MLNNRTAKTLAAVFFGVFIVAVIFAIARPGGPVTVVSGGSAQAGGKYQRPYPMPHQWWKKTDEFYVFASGGQQCGIYVYTLPMMKYLAEIPVYCNDNAWGWNTEDPKVKKMLTNPWTGQLMDRGDTHHPALSKTKGVYDGRWLFIPDKINPRVARIDLKKFRTEEIVWIPNTNGGLHGDHISPESDLFAVNFEHEQDPAPEIKQHLGVQVDPEKGPYLAGFAGIKVDQDGRMSNAWQVWGPFQTDLMRIGWGKSDGWIINTTYNSERATNTVGMFKKDHDYVFLWNRASIEKAVADRKYVTTKQAPDVPVVSWKDVEVYAVPIPLNPHGVDISPTGKYAMVSGKATSTVTAVDLEKALQAARDKKFIGEDNGIPILDPKVVYAAQMDIGLGATHIEFDDKGYAYIGYFVDSDVKKVTMGAPYTDLHKKEPWKVAEVIPAHYSVGHLLVPGSDTAKPYGKYLVVMNKLTKDTFTPHGPLITENHELFTIGDGPAQLVDQMPLGPETHYSQAIPVSLVKPDMVYEIPDKIETPRVEYDYDKKEARVYMGVVRSFFTPDAFNVPQGWKVKMVLTSEEEAFDITHGFTIDGYNVALSVDPGEVREVEFTADKAGVYWFYCMWFCSELHMEMRGRMIVIPESEWSKDKETKVVLAE